MDLPLRNVDSRDCLLGGPPYVAFAQSNTKAQSVQPRRPAPVDLPAAKAAA
jgi:hypothetical protein